MVGGNPWDLRGMASEAASRWVSNAVARYASVPGTAESAAYHAAAEPLPNVTSFIKSHPFKNVMRTIEMETILLSKKATLERLLWDSMKHVVAEVAPSMTAQSVIKGEAGLSRLLLSADTMHFLVYSLVCEAIEPMMGNDRRLDRGMSSVQEWNRLAWRMRYTARASSAHTSGRAVRNWDYSDMISQHTMGSMVLLHLGQSNAIRRGMTKGDAASAWMAGATWWVAASAARTTIRWSQQDTVSKKYSWATSTLCSGSRGTADTNVEYNAAYSSVAMESFEETFGEQPLLDEHEKGDDSESTMKGSRTFRSPWLTAVVIDALMRWCTFQGAQVKCLTGAGWSEWLK
eukprot:1174808-Amphidinium_carterae.1